MDCMASNAATKNGLVLSSLPAASGIVVQSPRATTECEFDLAATQIAEPARTLDRNCKDYRCPDRTANTRSSYRARPAQHDDVLAQLKAKPLRGGPNGPALT
jgi:hypothetical protein